MITLFSLAFLAFVLYVVARQIQWYNEIVFTKYRFRYFALRDRLALLVIDGTLEESSWEYKHIVNAINHHIRSVETMSIRQVVMMLSEFHSSQDELRNSRKIEKQIDNNKVIEIVVDFMNITNDLLRRNSKAELLIFRLLHKIIKNNKSPRERYGKPKKALDEINAFRDKLNDRLTKLAA